jgi:coenzyme F420-reducing hydrogenase beta subunit
VVLRTDKGAEIFNEAVDEGWLETRAFPGDNLEHLKEAAQNKRERGKKSIIKGFRGQTWE